MFIELCKFCYVPLLVIDRTFNLEIPKYKSEVITNSYHVAQNFDSGKFLRNQGWENFDKEN